MPKISVIMPAYNAEKYIDEAIDSILNQTYKDFELIIINDGSTDNTKEIILKYDDPRIIYLENEKNRGIVKTLNKGLNQARGEYIARMDADDIAIYNRFEKQIEYLDDNKDVGILGTGIRIFGENIKPQERIFTTNPEQLKAELIFNSCIAHSTVMMRRSNLIDNGLQYNEKFPGREDFALWWEIVKVSKVNNISDILLNYRIHKKQITQNKDKKNKENSLELLEIRMKDIGVNLSSKEMMSVLLYCRSEFEKFTYEAGIYFIDGLNKIIKQNKKNNFFEDKNLKKVLGLAVTFTCQKANLTQKEKRKLFFHAVKKQVYSVEMTVKLLYHGLLKSRK